MKNKMFILTFIISIVCFGQNNFKLSNASTVLINKGIIFTFKTPLNPFTEEEESYSSNGNNNLVKAFYARTSDNIVALQIYSTTIPPQFKNYDWNSLINSTDNKKKFLESFLNSKNKKLIISKYDVKKINDKYFIEVLSTSENYGVTQKQINWITVYENTFINVLGVTLLNKFDENLSFFVEFSNSLFLK